VLGGGVLPDGTVDPGSREEAEAVPSPAALP